MVVISSVNAGQAGRLKYLRKAKLPESTAHFFTFETKQNDLLILHSVAFTDIVMTSIVVKEF